MEERRKMSAANKAAIIVSSVLILIVLAVMSAEVVLEHKVRRAVENAIAASGNNVKVNIGHVSVSLPSRSVAIHDVTLRSENTDTGHRGFTVVSLAASVDKIALRHIAFKKHGGGKPVLDIGSVVVDRPRAALVTESGKSDEEGGGEPFSLQGLLSGKLGGIAVRDVSVSGVSYDHLARQGQKQTRIEIEDGRFFAAGFRLDTVFRAGKTLFSDNIGLSAAKVRYTYGGGSFVLQADTLSADAAAGTLRMKRAALVPQYPKDEFAQKSEGHRDWTEFTLEDVAFRGLDYAGFQTDSVLSADSVSMGSVRLSSYKNRQVHQQERVKPMLYQTIQNLPVKIDIHHVDIADLYLQYDELAIDADTCGSVVMTKGRASVKNLTNITDGHDRFFTVDLSVSLMDDGPMQAIFLLPVSPADDHWEVSGTLGRMNAASLNRVLEPLMDLRIKSGIIHGVDFHVTGTLEQSATRLTMPYSDLSVALLKKHDHTRERRILTFIADEILIKQDNPSGSGEIRHGEGAFTRDPNRSMYNYMWKSILSGVMDTVK